MGDAAAPLVRGVEGLVAVMLQITNYVMRFAPLAVFGAVAATLTERGAGVIGQLAFFMLSFYLALAILWVVQLGAGAAVVGGRMRGLIRYIREPLLIAFTTASSEAAYPRLLEALEAVRRAQPDRQLRVATWLFVQSRRLDGLYDLRVAVHRAGLWHPPRPRHADRDAALSDGVVEGHCRGAARQPGGDRRDAASVSYSRGRLAIDPGG